MDGFFRMGHICRNWLRTVDIFFFCLVDKAWVGFTGIVTYFVTGLMEMVEC